MIELWQRRSVEEAAALAPYAARVAAAGLPLAMVDDADLATAAQKLLDAALEDQGEDAVREAITGLHAVFYGRELEPTTP
ncbi:MULTISPECIES: hypothetical protein [unclassified Streptomyces]|uniref:hypothetical protein n=1 Tax=unclassified Streptomyces TaxID=2593676 RepID=UPI002254CE5F|nr:MULTISPECIES: hypothetical protein [unclassified Streptomyces]MCX5327924.1 hypothetical protein [Streptomyces sp. NBC_00140]MCX5357414.1 hypothetical protein [Streptomyces sp. NBC_00124]